LKRVIKSVAYDHEMDTTFMAKPYAGQSGSGMHLHISLLDENGQNVFAGDPQQPNDQLRWAVGGLVEVMNASMALLCPNINSYRRFSPEFYVPSAATWGLDNRTTALRIPGGDPEALRIEHRVAGADANPYLLMAAILAGVHYGLTHRIEPPPMMEGNAHEQQDANLVNNLRDALRSLEESDVLRDYLGADFLKVFVACKEHEINEFEHTISDLEYLWYLHTV
jgi:glutamine synthetase